MEPVLIIPPKQIDILGTPVHHVSMDQTLQIVSQFMLEPRLHQIATTNPEFVMTAQKDAEFRRILHTVDLCIPDGVGLLYASRWLGDPLIERVPGSELVYRLAETAVSPGWRLFLLGAAPGVAQAAADIFQHMYPGLIIAGTYAGSPALSENDAIVERINASGADILFVAYGAPKQDKWIDRNREKLTAVRVAIGIGGSLDFVTGKSVRPPEWARKVGLEWLYRLYLEPWRWRRMLALPKFALRVILSKGKKNI